MSTRPNIILITTDQQRGDCLGIDGHPVLQTPHLDWLAESGARFRHAYTECPSCMPARRVLFSGTAPAANGMVGMKADHTWSPAHTLAGELTRAGYQTEMIGKSHVTGGNSERWRYGFEHVQMANNSNTGDYAEWLRHQGVMAQDAGYAHGQGSNAWTGRPHHLPEELMHSFWCVDRALHFLRNRDTANPFFLNISLIDPHPPLTPPRFHYDRYIDKQLPEPVIGNWARDLGGPRTGFDPNAWDIHLQPDAMQASRAAYYGMINFVDDQVGRLLQQMRGLVEETVFVFTSDHGEMLGDHHLFRKCFPYEASARVPLLVRLPKSVGAQRTVSDAAVGLQDIMPTLLDIAGADIPATVTGKSLLPVITGAQEAVREVLHGEHMGQYAPELANHYLTDGAHKYVWLSEIGREQLFDLEADPDEAHDLAGEPDREERLQPWRKRLIEVLADRPEGFTDGKQLIAGRPQHHLVPGYEPDTVRPFL